MGLDMDMHESILSVKLDAFLNKLYRNIPTDYSINSVEKSYFLLKYLNKINYQ